MHRHTQQLFSCCLHAVELHTSIITSRSADKGVTVCGESWQAGKDTDYISHQPQPAACRGVGFIFFNRPYQVAPLFSGSNIYIAWRPGPKRHHSAVKHTLFLFVLDQNEPQWSEACIYLANRWHWEREERQRNSKSVGTVPVFQSVMLRASLPPTV